MDYSVIILAAGKGSRTHLEYNKIFFALEDGRKLIQMTVEPFLSDSECKQMIVVTTKDEIEIMQELLDDTRIKYVFGGDSRQESVYNGLQVITCDYVMIHDGARCFIDSEIIDRCKQTLENDDACLVMVASTDTPKVVEDGYVVKTLNRKELYNAQTPQSFKTSLIKECYQKGKDNNFKATDDAQLVEKYSDVPIAIVEGKYINIKITTQKDLFDLLNISAKLPTI